MNRQQRQELRDRLQARFQQLQTDEDWTQETLAEGARLHTRVVSDFVRSASVPNEKTLKALASALDISLTAEDERAKWDPDITGHLDMYGLILAKTPQPKRREIMEAVVKFLLTHDSPDRS